MRRRWEGSPGWVAPGSKSEGRSETGRERAEASEGPGGGLGKEKLFTAHPRHAVQGVQPAPTPPHTLDSTQLSPRSSLRLVGTVHSAKCHSVQPPHELPLCPSPTTGSITLPLELSGGRSGH